MDRHLLGGLSADAFLKRYWQRRPLLVRGAFKGFKDPLSPDELAGLAMEEGVSSRLVMSQAKGSKPWRVQHGPFTHQQLSTLPESHWSLLVSRVNEYVDAAARLIEKFDFVPRWRMDDLMVSFAPTFGTVGAHVDSYDVFLIQGMGRRRWQIATKPDLTYQAGLDLKILKHFESEREWILEPGDMLYLPPGVAHYGVALEPCMTYSVGFRAPSLATMLQDLYNLDANALQMLAGDRLYEDPGLAPAGDPGEIDAAALARLANLLRAPLEKPELLGRWFGRHVTRPDEGVETPASRARPRMPTLERRLQNGAELWRADEVRVAWLCPEGDAIYVYIGGEEHAVSKKLRSWLKRLSAKHQIDGRSLLAALPRTPKLREEGLMLLAQMVAAGALRIEKA